MPPLEIQSVAEWNTTLRSATADGQSVIVDFHAVWCGPCKAIAPKYDDLAKKNAHVKFVRVDVDKMKAIAQKYQISAMPTFLAIKAGQVVDTLKGADPNGLATLVAKNAGPNPPIAPLPPDAEAKKSAGNNAFKNGQYAEAVELYSAAIEIAPTSFTLYGNRAFAYLKSTPAQHEMALIDAQKAVELSPRWGKGWVRVGESLAAGGRDKESIEAFEKAVQHAEGTVKTEAKQKLSDAKKKLGWH